MNKRYKVTFQVRSKFHSVIVEAADEKSAWNKAVAKEWRMVTKIELLSDEE